MPPPDDPIEDLLAQALAEHDERGETGLAQFLAHHPEHRAALEKGVARCRELGLLGHSAPAREFPERLGEFRLLRRLGSGGMGVVYEAEQESLGRRVAIKVVRPELLYFEGARERFRREIEAIARLSHPAIVPVLASGEQDGVPWYAMELLDGQTAHELCAAVQGRDPAALRGEDLRRALGAQAGTATDPFAGSWWQACVRIGHAIALGVRHAHLRGIVHRDIKPSNVMLTRDGRTVLLDFGVAMVTGGREFTRTGNTPGSPAFMSPEQLRGDVVDERTDVYSLAATLWQLLTLRQPFHEVDLQQRLREVAAPPVRAVNREIPPELALVLSTAMDPDRERRYADMAAFADDLLAVLQRRAIRARKLGLRLRAWRWCQRRRATATALAALVCVALLLPAVLAWRERAQNQQLQAAIARGDRSFATTLAAIDKMLVTLANDKLRYVPEAEAVTLEALQQAGAMYDTLLAEDPGHAHLREQAGLTRSRIGATLHRLGRRAEAIAMFERAIALIGDGLELETELLATRAYARMQLAALHKEFKNAPGSTDRLRETLNAAERDYGELIARGNRRADALTGQAQIASLRYDLPEVQADRDAAVKQSRVAVDLARQALALGRGEPDLIASLARHLDNLATALIGHRDEAEADAILDEALRLVRSLPHNARVWPPRDVFEADVLDTLGNLQQRRKDPRQRETLAECMELRQRASDRHPDDIDLLSRLGGALHNLARTYCGDDASPADLERALEYLGRAIPAQRKVLTLSPDFDRARTFLFFHVRLRGNSLARLGRRGELEQAAEELAEDDRNPEHQRAVARFWLRAMAMPEDAATKPRDHRTLALNALLTAERIGWRSNSKLDEAVYRPLHDLPEFVALRERLQAAKGPTDK